MQQVLQDALDRPPAERGAFVASACGDDDELRDEVESLVRAEVAAGGFLIWIPNQSAPRRGLRRDQSWAVPKSRLWLALAASVKSTRPATSGSIDRLPSESFQTDSTRIRSASRASRARRISLPR